MSVLKLHDLLLVKKRNATWIKIIKETPRSINTYSCPYGSIQKYPGSFEKNRKSANKTYGFAGIRG